MIHRPTVGPAIIGDDSDSTSVFRTGMPDREAVHICENLPAHDEPVVVDEQFAVWVRDNVAMLTVLARREVGPSDADDLVQETFVRAWQRRRTFDPSRASVRTWLVMLLLSRSGRFRSTILPWRRYVEPDESVAAPGLDSDQYLDLDRAIRALPRRQQQVVTLHYIADLSVAEIATVLGVSVGTAKSQLFDARASLRRTFGAAHE